ncbi:hypothetical protein ACIBG8_29135 [Nonomuraea sp. NPDC050556]|uniref:ISAzo13-like element transposase-related protein n=1 Tax=Nonomuraea sp. NPDC050556 TaxID=3364369 RepID=UPI003798320C
MPRRRSSSRAFKNARRGLRPTGQSVAIAIYDLDAPLGTAISNGIYDLAAESGRSISAPTTTPAAFAVESIRCWWKWHRSRHPPERETIIRHKQQRLVPISGPPTPPEPGDNTPRIMQTTGAVSHAGAGDLAPRLSSGTIKKVTGGGL